MVGCRFDTRPAQIAINFFYVFAGSRIDDAERRPAGQLHNSPNLFLVRCDLTHFKVKVWTIESTDDLSRVRDAKLRQDIAAHRGGGSGSQCKDWRRFQLRDDVAQTQIIRTKIMAP